MAAVEVLLRHGIVLNAPHATYRANQIFSSVYKVFDGVSDDTIEKIIEHEHPADFSELFMSASRHEMLAPKNGYAMAVYDLLQGKLEPAWKEYLHATKMQVSEPWSQSAYAMEYPYCANVLDRVPERRREALVWDTVFERNGGTPNWFETVMQDWERKLKDSYPRVIGNLYVVNIYRYLKIENGYVRAYSGDKCIATSPHLGTVLSLGAYNKPLCCVLMYFAAVGVMNAAGFAVNEQTRRMIAGLVAATYGYGSDALIADIEGIKSTEIEPIHSGYALHDISGCAFAFLSPIENAQVLITRPTAYSTYTVLYDFSKIAQDSSTAITSELYGGGHPDSYQFSIYHAVLADFGIVPADNFFCMCKADAVNSMAYSHMDFKAVRCMEELLDE